MIPTRSCASCTARGGCSTWHPIPPSRSCAWRPTCCSRTTPRSCSTTPCSTARSSSTPPTGTSTAPAAACTSTCSPSRPARSRAPRTRSSSALRAPADDGARRVPRALLRARRRPRRRARGPPGLEARMKHLVLVVGVGRSGTSLLSGHPRPARLPHPAARGPGRRHEPARVRRAALGGGLPLARPRRRARVTLNDSRPAAWKQMAEAGAPPTTASCASGWAGSSSWPTHVVVKDPRTVWFLDAWQRCAARARARAPRS